MTTQRILAVLLLVAAGAAQAHAQAMSGTDAQVVLGASSADAASGREYGSYFVRLALSHPLTTAGRSRTPALIGIWVDGSVDAVAGSYAPPILERVDGFSRTQSPLSTVTRGIDALAGLELWLGRAEHLGHAADGRKTRKTSRNQVRFSVTGSLGVVAPFAISNTVETFALTDDTARQLSIPSSTPPYRYVAFVQQRDRAALQWYAGLRMKTFRFTADRSADRVGAPATVDLQLGQNKALQRDDQPLTARVAALVPLPLDGRARAVTFAATVFVPLGPRPEPVVAALVPADSGVPGSSVYQFPLTRDQGGHAMWRFGVGVDLLRLLRSPR